MEDMDPPIVSEMLVRATVQGRFGFWPEVLDGQFFLFFLARFLAAEEARQLKTIPRR